MAPDISPAGRAGLTGGVRAGILRRNSASEAPEAERSLRFCTHAPVDTYLQVGTTSVAQRLLGKVLRDAASLQAGQTALVGGRGLAVPRAGRPARAGRSCLSFAWFQQVPISGHGCMEAWWFRGHYLLPSLPGREGEACRAPMWAVQPRPGSQAVQATSSESDTPGCPPWFCHFLAV